MRVRFLRRTHCEVSRCLHGERPAGNWRKRPRKASSAWRSGRLEHVWRARSLVGSNAWRKAFEHVAEHFEKRFVYEKGVHGVFVSALRSREALEPLVKLAVSKPSRKAAGRASVNGVFSGRICTIMEREFANAIGVEWRLEGRGSNERRGENPQDHRRRPRKTDHCVSGGKILLT